MAKVKTRKTKSLMSPDQHLTVMPAAIDRIKQGGVRDDQIAVPTPYKGKLMMNRNLGLPNGTIITIDAA